MKQPHSFPGAFLSTLYTHKFAHSGKHDEGEPLFEEARAGRERYVLCSCYWELVLFIGAFKDRSPIRKLCFTVWLQQGCQAHCTKASLY
jgi:hypothetical protein